MCVCIRQLNEVRRLAGPSVGCLPPCPHIPSAPMGGCRGREDWLGYGEGQASAGMLVELDDASPAWKDPR